MIKASIIVAAANCGTVGLKQARHVEPESRDNQYLPWSHIPEDMKYFSETTKTKGAVVVMGYTTWLTLPEKYRVLPGRILVVLTRDSKKESVLHGKDGARTIVTSIFDNLIKICSVENTDHVWVAGGAEIYDLFLGDKKSDVKVISIHRTLINQEFICSEAGNSLSQEEKDRFVIMPAITDPIKGYSKLGFVCNRLHVLPWGKIEVFSEPIK